MYSLKSNAWASYYLGDNGVHKLQLDTFIAHGFRKREVVSFHQNIESHQSMKQFQVALDTIPIEELCFSRLNTELKTSYTGGYESSLPTQSVLDSRNHQLDVPKDDVFVFLIRLFAAVCELFKYDPDINNIYVALLGSAFKWKMFMAKNTGIRSYKKWSVGMRKGATLK